MHGAYAGQYASESTTGHCVLVAGDPVLANVVHHVTTYTLRTLRTCVNTSEKIGTFESKVREIAKMTIEIQFHFQFPFL